MTDVDPKAVLTRAEAWLAFLDGDDPLAPEKPWVDFEDGSSEEAGQNILRCTIDALAASIAETDERVHDAYWAGHKDGNAERNAAHAATQRRLEAASFEAQGYLDVVNREKPNEAEAMVSMGFIRRVAALAPDAPPDAPEDASPRQGSESEETT